MPTLGELRDRRAGAVAVACAVIAGVSLLVATRSLTFAGDDWDVILASPHSSVLSWLTAHNGHWSTMEVLVFEALFRIDGIRSYAPFMATLLALHAGSALLLFTYVRHRAGDAIGLACMISLLFYGNGGDGFLWAQQVTFTGSVCFGLLALVLLDREVVGPGRLVVAFAALMVALMFSNIGVFFCFYGIIVSRQRNRLLVFAAPLAVFAIWFLAFGRNSPGLAVPPSLPPGGSGAVVTFVVTGISAASLGLLGPYHAWAADGWAALLFALLVFALVAWWRGSPERPVEVLSAAVALVAMFLVTAVVRAQLGAYEATASRYMYPAAVFMLIIVAMVARTTPRGSWRAAALGVLLTASVVANAALVGLLIVHKSEEATYAKAEMETAGAVRGTCGLDMDIHLDQRRLGNVSAGSYFRAVDHLGAPVPAITKEELGHIPPAPLESALARMFGHRIDPQTAPRLRGGC
jgi:hypothetical protein